MTETDWETSCSPYDMLHFLDGKMANVEFVRFNVACCRRIWPLISDPRSRAVVEAVEQWLAGTMNLDSAKRVCDDWYREYENEALIDLANGNSHEAIEYVFGGGYGYAAAVAAACFESVGYAASEPLRQAAAAQVDITAAWNSAASAERVEQCRLLRELFGHVINRQSSTDTTK